MLDGLLAILRTDDFEDLGSLPALLVKGPED